MASEKARFVKAQAKEKFARASDTKLEEAVGAKDAVDSCRKLVGDGGDTNGSGFLREP